MAIVRPFAAAIERDFYNCQELGLGRALSELYCDVDVFSAGNGRTIQTTRIETNGPGILRLLEVPFFSLPNIRQAVMPKLHQEIAAVCYDFIQVNESNEIESWLVSRLARRRSVLVSLYQGMYEPIRGRVQRAFQFAFDRCCLPELRRNVCAPLAKTKRAAKFLDDRGFENIRVLPVGLDPTPFATRDDRNWREVLCIPKDNAVLTYVGKLEARRKPQLLVALAAALDSLPVSFVIVGSGPMRDEISRSIALRNLDNAVMLGPLPQVQLPSLYEQSTFLLLPSHYEIYGMVVLEAMYFGLPVIANRTAGPESLIHSQEDGLLLEDLKVETWMQAIKTAIRDRAGRNAMGRAGAAKVRARFMWDVVARQYVNDIILPALKGNVGPNQL